MRDNKLHNQKGFTMAELLIVVAIIAVLVAIGIPVFNTQLEKSREAYDIYTMRQAASAAVDLYYSGVHDGTSAATAGLSWSTQASSAAEYNAFGAYDPSTGQILKDRASLPARSKTYGKGTKTNGGTTYVMGSELGAYKADEDYRNAVVMVSIYPNASPAYVAVYWKNNISGNNTYVGGQGNKRNVPKYYLRIDLN